MGSNVVPYLVYRLKHEAVKTYWLRKADRLFHTGTKFERSNFPAVLGVRRGMSGLGLKIVPELEKVMEESSNDEVLYEAYLAGDAIVGIQSDSRFNTLRLSSNAVTKVNAALAKHESGPMLYHQ